MNLIQVQWVERIQQDQDRRFWMLYTFIAVLFWTTASGDGELWVWSMLSFIGFAIWIFEAVKTFKMNKRHKREREDYYARTGHEQG